MAKKLKFFVVATEGNTTDGRQISRQWIEQMAKNYDPKTYGARINLEHIKFSLFWADEPHSRAYGDVVALKTEENADGKLQLLAQIDPTEELIKLTSERQKIYTSVEIDLDFAGTGEAYLVGLAVTDSPASLGTEYLKFCAGATENPLTARKQKPDNLIGQAVEFSLHFAEDEKESMFSRIRGLLVGEKKQNDLAFADQSQALMLLADTLNGAKVALTQLEADHANLTQQVANLEKENQHFRELFAKLEQTEHAHYTPKPTATGNQDAYLADC
ncbi:capsid scaffolding protein [Pasteurellaceae bacterium Macca]|nr:capsid scaffolding protein [Pasteurellaceae bacterium Macca]